MKKNIKNYGRSGDILACDAIENLRSFLGYKVKWDSSAPYHHRIHHSSDETCEVSCEDFVVRLAGRAYREEIFVLHPKHGPIWIKTYLLRRV